MPQAVDKVTDIDRLQVLSVITIIDVVMFTLFDGVSGGAERECSDRAPCQSWC